jgi:hypothetical protein
MFWSFPGGEVTNDTYIRDLTVKYQLPSDSPLVSYLPLQIWYRLLKHLFKCYMSIVPMVC